MLVHATCHARPGVGACMAECCCMHPPCIKLQVCIRHATTFKLERVCKNMATDQKTKEGAQTTRHTYLGRVLFCQEQAPWRVLNATQTCWSGNQQQREGKKKHTHEWL